MVNVFGKSPQLVEAYTALLERRAPPGIEKAAYLRECQLVLEEAVDQFQTARSEPRVFRQSHLTESRKFFRFVPELDSQTQVESPALDTGRKSQSAV